MPIFEIDLLTHGIGGFEMVNYQIPPELEYFPLTRIGQPSPQLRRNSQFQHRIQVLDTKHHRFFQLLHIQQHLH